MKFYIYYTRTQVHRESDFFISWFTLSLDTINNLIKLMRSAPKSAICWMIFLIPFFKATLDKAHVWYKVKCLIERRKKVLALASFALISDEYVLISYRVSSAYHRALPYHSVIIKKYLLEDEASDIEKHNLSFVLWFYWMRCN